jgi:putative transposase
MYQFIQTHRDEFAIGRMCAVLGISRSSYYAWRSRPPRPRDAANAHLLEQIRAIFRTSRQTYGSPRIYAELRARGYSCNHKRVARLMRQHGIQVQPPSSYKRTTRANPNVTPAPNRLQRDFAIGPLNQRWVSDFTYIPTQQGWLYLAVVIDVGSRRVIGWAMQERMNQDLTYNALQMALQQRHIEGASLLHHSDQGSQYTATRYLETLQLHHITLSMSRTADCYDNALAESFFASLKKELIHRTTFLTRQQAITDIFDYIEVFYNRQRRHSSLHYLTPVEFERTFVA